MILGMISEEDGGLEEMQRVTQAVLRTGVEYAVSGGRDPSALAEVGLIGSECDYSDSANSVPAVNEVATNEQTGEEGQTEGTSAMARMLNQLITNEEKFLASVAQLMEGYANSLKHSQFLPHAVMNEFFGVVPILMELHKLLLS
jgi:hypothetical protein